MKFLIIFGPQAVGKMTVGHEVERLTGLKLFHNHMTIELVHPLLSYGTKEGVQLVREIRNIIFDKVSKSNLDGLIFTYLWNFNSIDDGEYIKSVSNLFAERGATVCWVELEADRDTRLIRNKTEHRLYHKPSKRDTKWSEKILVDSESKSRHNSESGEITFENYLKINNNDLDPTTVAEMIVKEFNLPKIS